MQVLHLPDAEGPKEFSYDEEWLAVLRSTHSLMSLQRRPVSLPGQLLPSLNDVPDAVSILWGLFLPSGPTSHTSCGNILYMAGPHCHRQR